MTLQQNTDLGQHFMKDELVLKDIVTSANCTENEVVLEIGSGNGALTKHLKKLPIKLTTVEIDTRYKADIQDNILEIIEDLSFNSIVANLPYHISEPLFIKLSKILPQKIVVVVGEQFAQHLLHTTILGEVFRESYEIEYVRSIDASSFHPPPKVASALIKCLKKDKSGPLHDFYSYSKSKVKNYLKTKTTKKEAQEFINKLPLPLQEKRLYELSREEFLQVANVIRLIV